MDCLEALYSAACSFMKRWSGSFSSTSWMVLRFERISLGSTFDRNSCRSNIWELLGAISMLFLGVAGGVPITREARFSSISRRYRCVCVCVCISYHNSNTNYCYLWHETIHATPRQGFMGGASPPPPPRKADAHSFIPFSVNAISSPFGTISKATHCHTPRPRPHLPYLAFSHSLPGSPLVT